MDPRPRTPIQRCLEVFPLALLLAITPLAATVARAAPTDAPFFTGLGDLSGGDFYSIANGVSGDGSTVVGTSHSSSSQNSFEAFRWTESGGMVGLGTLGPGAPKSTANAASFDGSVIVGRADTSLALADRAPYRWTAQTGMVALTDSLGQARGGEAHDVSGDGAVIAGVHITDIGENEAFRWTAANGVVGLGWLPTDSNDSFAFGISGDGSVVVGCSNSGTQGVAPFVWSQGPGMVSLGDVPGGIFYAIAWDVSADGEWVVGNARATVNNDESFIWSEASGFIFPDTLRGTAFTNTAFAVSGDGSVVVGSSWNGPIIWDAAHGLRDVTAVLEDDFGLDLTGWLLGSVIDISDDGSTIVGTGRNPSGQTEGWIARIPVLSGIGEGTAGPAGVTLFPLGPNPFAEETAFRLEVAPDAGAVRADVLGVDGRRVRVLLDARLAPGAHVLRWDGRDAAGRRAGAGTFLLRVATSRGTISSKILRVP